jgi:integrase
MDKRNIKVNSCSTYLSALSKLKKVIDGDKKVEDTDFLKDYDKVMEAIHKEKRITSKKNKLTAVIVALSSDDIPNEKLIDKYSDDLKSMSDKYTAFLKTQEKTDTQKENWIEYEDLINVVNKVMREVKLREINKKKELDKKEFDLLQQYVILRTYMEFPLRNDFADMKVIKNRDYKRLEKKDDNNYLVLGPGNKKTFHINQFKNKKFLGSKKLEITKKLNRLLNLWFKHNKSGYYLVKNDMKTPMSPNGITKFLNKIFMRLTKKKISSSMIRHIVISHMLKDEKTIAEKEQEAREIENKFFHSSKINQLYRKIR